MILHPLTQRPQPTEDTTVCAYTAVCPGCEREVTWLASRTDGAARTVAAPVEHECRPLPGRAA